MASCPVDAAHALGDERRGKSPRGGKAERLQAPSGLAGSLTQPNWPSSSRARTLQVTVPLRFARLTKKRASAGADVEELLRRVVDTFEYGYFLYAVYRFKGDSKNDPVTVNFQLTRIESGNTVFSRIVELGSMN